MATYMTMALQTLAAGVGTMAFCVLFRVPKRYFLDCGFVGTIEWIVYLFVKEQLNSNAMGVFCAALLITLLSRYFAVKRKCPMTIFLVTGIFPLVPGSGIYYMAYAAFNGAYNMAFFYCMEALKSAFAIAIAIAVGSTVPARFFHIGEKGKKL